MAIPVGLFSSFFDKKCIEATSEYKRGQLFYRGK
jgi:hypothetical protein